MHERQVNGVKPVAHKPGDGQVRHWQVLVRPVRLLQWPEARTGRRQAALQQASKSSAERTLACGQLYVLGIFGIDEFANLEKL